MASVLMLVSVTYLKGITVCSGNISRKFVSQSFGLLNLKSKNLTCICKNYFNQQIIHSKTMLARMGERGGGETKNDKPSP